MGSWLKTCGLTGLPIRNQEDVYLFVLEQQLEASCEYPLFKPVLVPILTKYNEYGAANPENCESFMTDFIMKGIISRLVEFSDSTGMSVLKQQFSMETFFEAVQKERLYINSRVADIPPLLDRYGNFVAKKSLASQVDFTMVRKAALNILAVGQTVLARDLKGPSFARIPVSPLGLRESTAKRGVGKAQAPTVKREPTYGMTN